MLCVYIFLFILLFFDRHLGCFHDFAIVSNVVMNLRDVFLRFNYINQGKK